jgi:uncharacterized repeat protein (TIGR03803 family)
LLCTFSANAQPSTFSNIYDFSQGPTNRGGFYYASAVIQGTDGRLYGTTSAGGSYSNGTVFVIERDGTGYRTLHSFATAPADGSFPSAGLLEGSDGRLYGVTSFGGSANAGTIFALNPNGSNYTILRHFSSDPSDARQPQGSLLESRDGRLYGITGGGTNGQGAVFGLNKDGTGFVVLRSLLASSTDAAYPQGPLIEGSDDALYGAATSGGIANAGAFFRLAKDGTYSVLHLYANGAPEGSGPRDALLEGGDGKLYGTTRSGGTANLGTVFHMDKDGGNYTILHHFAGGVSDGRNPDAGLVLGRDGLLYSSTVRGGAYDSGTLYRIAKDGSQFTLLYSFTASGDQGYWPKDALVPARDGAFYGTAPGGHNITNVKQQFGFIFRLGHRVGLARNGAQAHIIFEGIPGYQYALDYSSDLSTWAQLDSILMPASGHLEKDYPLPSNKAFFKLRAQ